LSQAHNFAAWDVVFERASTYLVCRKEGALVSKTSPGYLYVGTVGDVVHPPKSNIVNSSGSPESRISSDLLRQYSLLSRCFHILPLLLLVAAQLRVRKKRRRHSLRQYLSSSSFSTVDSRIPLSSFSMDLLSALCVGRRCGICADNLPAPQLVESRRVA